MKPEIKSVKRFVFDYRRPHISALDDYEFDGAFFKIYLGVRFPVEEIIDDEVWFLIWQSVDKSVNWGDYEVTRNK